MANPELVSNPGFLFEEQTAEFLGDLWRAWRKFSNALPRARRHRDLARHAQLNFHVKFSNIETKCVTPFRYGVKGKKANAKIALGLTRGRGHLFNTWGPSKKWVLLERA